MATKRKQESDQSFLWPVEADTEAKLEGWALFDCDGIISLQKLDDPDNVAWELETQRKLKTTKIPELESDESALQMVVKAAMDGSRMHALALFLCGRHSGDEIYIPKRLTFTREKAYHGKV